MDDQKFIPLYDDILKISDITPTDKIVLSLIYSFSKNGDCFASNEYLSDRTGIPKRSIERIISKLEKEKYLFFHLSMYTDEKGKVKGNKRQLWTFKDDVPDYARTSTPYTHRCVHPLRTDEYHIKKEYNKDKLESRTMNSNSRNSPSCENNTDTAEKIIPMERYSVNYIDEVLPKQIEKALGDKYGDSKDEYVKCYHLIVKHFFWKYERCRGEEHPAYKYENMKRCIDNLENVLIFRQDAPYDNEYCKLLDVIGIAECIDRFFEHNNKRKPHDYKLLVFTDPENMKYILAEEYDDADFISEGICLEY